MAMKLGSYTFEDEPDYDIPQAEKSAAVVQTYSSASFFSWGMFLVGKGIQLSWELMTQAQFEELNAIYQLNTSETWEPRYGQLTHGAVANGPFEAEKTVIGMSSGASGKTVYVGSGLIKVANISGTFTVSETIQEVGSSPTKSATVSAVSVPKYTVEIASFNGQYVEAGWGPAMHFRRGVKMNLVIMAEI